MKKINSIILAVVLMLMSFLIYLPSAKANERTYTEMAFGHWGVSEGEVYGTNVYSLSNKTISSLDGVAISGKVDFSTPGKMLRIGGTDALKHAGFWFWSGDGILHLSPQGIGGDGFDQAAIHGDVWNRVKDGAFILRLTFAKVTNGWDVGIYVNGEHFQTLTCPGKNTPLTPGLYIGIDPGLNVDMTIPSEPSDSEEKEYKEMMFSHWGVSEGEVFGTNAYSLTEKTITSLDGVAISGVVDFSTPGAKLRIGGTDALKHAGFWFWNGDGLLHLSPQGIGGDGFDQAAIHGDVWNSVKDGKFTLRLTFDKVATGWDVGIYVNGTHFQTLTCPGVNTALTPGLYIGIDPELDVDMSIPVDDTQVAMTEIYDQIKWSGRNELLSDGVAMDQAASGFEFKVSAEGKVTVTADVTAETYFTVYIDGVRQEERCRLTPTERTMTVAEFATGAEHVIRVVKQTEGLFSQCTIRSLGFKGSLKSKPADSSLYLEFLGDSIACGYGVLTDASNTNAGLTVYEDATHAFPFVTAQLLSADLSVLGCSGMGAVNGFREFVAKDYYVANSYYRNASKSYDFARVPDYVIINLGTNDVTTETTKAQFQAAVKELVAQVRGEDGYNAQVPIIWTDGLMMAHVKAWVTEIFTELGGAGAGLYVVTFEQDLNGGGTHPTPAGYEAAAKVLADFIKNNIEEDKAYTELKFSDWERYVGTAEGCMIYGLAENTEVQSLDGVAISGTVNFSKEGAKLRIGGTGDVKHGGFWLWSGDGILHLSPQGIGGDTYDAAAVHGNVWDGVKDGEFTLRLTFDQVQTGWDVGIYVNGAYFQTLTCTAKNTALVPGLYVSADSTEVAKGLGGETTSPSDDNYKYKELSFADWSKFVTITEGSYIYSLEGHKDVLSLDGIAISGTVNFGGKPGHIRIGGTEELMHAGFWVWSDGESFRLSPQGIGDVSDFWFLSGDAAKAYLDNEFTLRVAFKRNVKLGIWNVKISINGEEIGTYNCGNVVPGMYLGVDPSVVIDGVKKGEPNKEKNYKEMRFSDWNVYLGKTDEFDTYSLNFDSTLKSLDGVAVSGIVNFNGEKNKKIRIGGTFDNAYSGFWIFNDGENLRVSPQGIGGSGDYWLLTGKEWDSCKKKDMQLRLTFDKDKNTGAWFVGVFINGKEIGSYLCGAATPGLGLSVDHGIDIKGLGEATKKSGIDFRLWGYSNKNWRKEMGL